MEAFKDAGIDEAFLETNEVGVLYGNDSSTAPIINAVDIIREKKNTVLVGSGSIFQSMNSTVSMNLSVIFKLRGVNFTISGACASGSHAIGMGYLLIKSGLQDCILCLVLESYESAVKRGAPILAEIIGYGFSSNGDHISVPNIDGPKRSLEMAIRNAGIALDEIKYINAHATSTPIGDLNEAKAIAEVFEGHRPYVTSTKSMTGHEMWMAGASEVIYSTLMMQNNFIAPNLNFEEPDEASAQLNIPAQRVNMEFDTFLSNSFGFGGTNSTLIIKKVK